MKARAPKSRIVKSKIEYKVWVTIGDGLIMPLGTQSFESEAEAINEAEREHEETNGVCWCQVIKTIQTKMWDTRESHQSKKVTHYSSEWCECGPEGTFGSYPQDGQCVCGIHKHHVHCGTCGKISQTG